MLGSALCYLIATSNLSRDGGVIRRSGSFDRGSRIRLDLERSRVDLVRWAHPSECLCAKLLLLAA